MMIITINFPFITFFNYINGVYTFGLNKAQSLNPFVYFLRLNSFWRLDAASDITSCDTSKLKSNIEVIKPAPVERVVVVPRFLLIYNFVSYSYVYRLQLLVSVGDTQPCVSITQQFESTSWLEREIWDMHGIFFALSKDLRRLVTDYGFEGFPLRKDFPLSGFMEIFYNEYFKRVKYSPIEFMQGFRLFKFKI